MMGCFFGLLAVLFTGNWILGAFSAIRKRDVGPLLETNKFNRYLLEHVPRPFEIIFPKQIRRNMMVGISTREHQIRHHGTHEHFQQVTLQLRIDGKKHKIRLERNEALLSSGIKVKHYIGKHQQIISQTVEHCYYHGHVKRDEWSSVAVSTCGGIRGVIQMHNETFVIQPLLGGNEGTEHPHVVYRATTSKRETCGNSIGQWLPFHELHKGEFIRKLKSLNAQRARRDAGSEPDTKLRLALVLDSSMNKQLNMTDSEMTNYAIQMANIVDMYYKPLKIRTALVYLEYWNLRNKIKVSAKLRETLQNFMTFKETQLKDVSYDAAHFVTGNMFEGHSVGLAIPDSVCTRRAVGVSRNPDILEPQQVATILAHMIGHNLGIKHDEDGGCRCEDEFGCIMSTSVLANPGFHSRMFSSCGSSDLDVSLSMGILDCLKGSTEPTFPQECGNNFVERGEECDCGSPEECALTDPCCDPHTCLLKYWAECRSGACCSNCTFVSPQHICRERSSECDVPEFCSGQSGECPENNYVQDGHPCGNDTGYCLGGICPTLAKQCQGIWGTEARNADVQCFERFNPTGNFNGHCGKDVKTGSFAKCLPENIQCGLLHCEGGNKVPLYGSDKAFSKTTVFSNDVEYECKIVHGPAVLDLPHMGLVQDGSKCGDGNVCMNKQCVSVSVIMPPLACPGTYKDAICSGHGVCTKENSCFCDQGWGGLDCSEVVYVTQATIGMTTTTTIATTTTEVFRLIPVAEIFSKESTTVMSAASVLKVKEGGLSTTWLIIILASVVGGVVLALTLTFLCYRRRSPVKFNKNGKSLFAGGEKKEDSCSENGSRFISFGSLPSYRAEKLFGRKRKTKKGRSASEEESDIGELPPPPIIICNDEGLMPEKGILKNSRGSSDERQSSESNTGSGSGASDGNCDQDSVEPYMTDEDDAEAEEIQDILGVYDEPEHNLDALDNLPESNSFDFMLPLSNFSHSPSPPRKFGGFDLPLNGSYNPQRPFLWRTNPPSPPRSRVVRIKNLDDLMHTIDLSPSPDDPPVQISPSTSEDVRSSSTEDRYYQNSLASHTPQSPLSVTSGSTKDTVRPFSIGTQWSKYLLRRGSNDLDEDLEPSPHISIPPPMNPINIRNIYNYGQTSLARENNDTPLGSQNGECSSNNGTANSRNGYDKSSGYGSEHDPERFSIEDLSRAQSRSRSTSPPAYSAVIRTGPNQIKLIPGCQFQQQGARHSGSNEELQKLLEGLPRIDAGTFERSPIKPNGLVSTSLANTLLANTLPALGTGSLPSNKTLEEDILDYHDNTPCIDRSLEEIPQAFAENQKSKKKNRNSFTKSKRPITLGIKNDLSLPSQQVSEDAMDKKNSAVKLMPNQLEPSPS